MDNNDRHPRGGNFFILFSRSLFRNLLASLASMITKDQMTVVFANHLDTGVDDGEAEMPSLVPRASPRDVLFRIVVLFCFKM